MKPKIRQSISYLSSWVIIYSTSWVLDLSIQYDSGFININRARFLREQILATSKNLNSENV